MIGFVDGTCWDRTVAWVVWDGRSRYLAQGLGWVDRLSDATWFGSPYEAKQAASQNGGQILSLTDQ